MRIDLKKYLTEQYQRSIGKNTEAGPVITISREYGCSAKSLAIELLKLINTNTDNKKDWVWINKEVFNDTAKSLRLKEKRVQQVFEGKKLGLVDSIIMSSTERYYKSDIAIKKKMIETVRTFAEQGRTIIIGLGSVLICRDIKKSFHVKLIAPFDWRVKRVAEKRKRDVLDVQKYVKEIDQKRDDLRKSFEAKNTYEELFDLTFNVMLMDYKEIAEIILFAMKNRKIF